MKKKNLKYMFTVLIFMLVILFSKSVYANYQRGAISTETLRLTASVLNGDDSIYCVENGVYFDEPVTYNVTGTYDVQDPIFAYIINMDNTPERKIWGYKNVKQNMIWWYLRDHNTSEATTIKYYAGLYQRWTSNWPASYTLNVSALSTYTTAANNYAYRINNAKVKITNTEIKNNNLIISITAENIDKVKVSVNGIEASQGDTPSTYKISLENLGGASYATVKVVGINNVQKAKFQVLYTKYSQIQTLINTIAEGTEEKTVATDTLTVPVNTDVSLQKYITKVNNIDLKNANTSLTDRKNTYSEVGDTTVVSYSERDNMSNKYKKGNIVSIEAGDYVTYRIFVYNNSDVNASNVIITDTLPTLKGWYSINGGNYIKIGRKEITYTIKNLSANSSQYFDVTVYFSGYEEPRLDNKAEITSTTPNNNTTYRTVDEDYVQMKKYEVSLEKYISKIESSNTSESLLNVSTYKDIIDYLKENITNDKDVNYLINELMNKEQVTENFKVYDLNNDDKVDDKDVAIYEKIITVNKEDIENYLKADLNNDGIVDDKDITLYNKYMEYKADLNKDGVLNKLDKYAFIVKHLNDKSILNNDTLTNLYFAKLLKSDGKENIISKIEEYIKSDVDDNGVVNKIDGTYPKYDLTNQNINKITNEPYNETDTKAIVEEFISKLDSEEKQNIAVIQKIIEIFDINEDRLLNQDDIKIYNLYKTNRPNDWGEPIEDLIGLKEEMLKEPFIINKDSPNYKEEYDVGDDKKISFEEHDVDGDKKISFEDYMFWTSAYIDESELNNETTKNTPDEVRIAKNIKKLLSFNVSGVSASGESWLDVSMLKYDLNNDNKVDIEDYKLLSYFIKIQEYENTGARKVESLLNDKILEKAIEYYNVIECYFENENGEEIKKYYMVDENSNQANLSKEDIIEINLYKGFKEFDENLNTSDYQKYDINNDGLINNTDKQLIQNYENKAFINSIDEKNSDDLFNNILVNDYEEFVEYLKNVLENNIDISGIDTNIYNSYDDLSSMIKSEDKNVENIEIEATKTLSLDGISNAMKKNISDLDINGDDIVSKADTALYDNRENVSKLSIALIQQNDIDGDGDWDKTDYEISKQVQILKGKSQAERDKIKSSIKALINNEEQGLTNRKEENGKKLAEHNFDNDPKTFNYTKYNNVCIASKGDFITYTITVNNDSKDTSVYISEITDYLPSGVKYNNISYEGENLGNNYCKEFSNTLPDKKYAVTFDNLSGILLKPKESTSFTVTVEVIENNMSVNILKNTAKITQIKNKNGITMNADEADSTPNNNTDSDYFQMRDIVISGTVWNDKALNKTQDNYNGTFDNGSEDKLSGINVKLYRGDSLISSTTTDSNGDYKFALNYIKGPKIKDTNRWAGTYYSYYVVFEYDGITYTSTFDSNGKKIWDISENDLKNSVMYSNAKEDNGKVNESRSDFNNRFSSINNNSGINYRTVNEDGYIPQSIHEYNANTMAMQSSTNKIELSNTPALEQQLQHINLGLRGRDIFDLELTSDVDTIKITVNNQQGVYKYTNKATLRKADLTPTSTTNEDMANTELENSHTYVYEDTEERQNGQHQNIRTSDLNVTNTGANKTAYGENQRISNIEVTYKITVHNASRTAGTATKITNYYDSKYEYKEVLPGKNCAKIEKVENGTSGSGYNSKIITANGKMLGQSETMEIYVVYTLKTPVTTTLQGLTKENSIPTFNMAEITEYKTQCASGQTEYTRGLLDKDSKPESANTEQVRLTTTEGQNTATVGGNPTTVEYYFSKKNNSSVDLSILKYEDDTYATPTLYFVADGSMRTITGTVFEDYTKLINNDANDELIRVKTGDGKQDKEYNIEPGIKGATVELYEIVEGKEVLRYTTNTKEKGDFTFEGFLPGNYIIKYRYGDTNDTFLLDNAPNTKSYNGEDFQSTNNTGSYESNKLRYDDLGDEQKFWYAYNKSKGISTATDIVERRQQVSTNVTEFNDDQMTGLNNARDGKGLEESNVEFKNPEGENIGILGATKMEAQTNPMLLTVEETVVDGSSTKQKNSFSDYIVSNMNFGIAEVPVTTIDLQKHVYSFKITDSTGKNPLAALERDLTNTAVTVNPSKIAANRLSTVIKVLSENLNLKAADVEELIDYNTRKNINENVSIKTGLNEEEINKLKDAITNYSLAREIEIVQAWKVTSGNVLAAPGAETLDVSIEDDKLQGAKLEVTYEITATISAEKNFNNDAVTVPSIEGILDYIDNNLSYNENSQTKEKTNKDIWSIAKQSEVKFGEEGTPYGERFGTLDPEGKLYNTILSIKDGSDLLLERCGTGTSYVTLEKVLSSNDTTIQDIIMNNVEIYEYKNSVEITRLNYDNQQETGSTDRNEFIYRDRIRTADRYIILAGRQHDSAISETITIHPPTGDSSINIIYYVIAAVSLIILVAGVFGIKKFVLKK